MGEGKKEIKADDGVISVGLGIFSGASKRGNTMMPLFLFTDESAMVILAK